MTSISAAQQVGIKTAAASSTVGSQPAQKKITEGQEQQQHAETAWSLLGKMYSSQVLAYMVAITDAQALVKRLRSMRPGPPLHLPGEVQCMDVWELLQGVVQQQRVWTFGLQLPAALPATSADAHVPAEQATPAALRPTSAAQSAAAAAAAAVPLQSLVQPCVSSSEPQSIKDGVRFTCCAAGHQHSAAAAEGGYVFTWGSNDKGQLGCDTMTQQPVAIHVLSTPADAASVALGSTRAPAPTWAEPVADSAPAAIYAVYSRIDSLKLLGSTVNLPTSLMVGLKQQRQREWDTACEEQEQQQLLLQELLAHPELEQQQRLAGKPAALQPSAAQAAAHAAVLSGIRNGSDSSRQQQQRDEEPRPPALAVYQLHLGQAIRCIACGAHHTLAALASSGLMAWGLNDKGQLGAPAGLYKQVNSPMRIHGFDGQRIACISAGGKHSAAVQDGGAVVTWGHGRFGRLGVGGTPDILPPSVVAGLRGCCVTQVACGTAHTLALTSDGRVYAFGYNGQGALGTGDEQDRVYPALVLGLPSCMQVAAAASSMALSTTGEVFMWGGAAGKRLQLAQAAADSSTCSSSMAGSLGDSAAGHGALSATGSSCVQKCCVPWLSGVKAMHITCGVDTAAAVTSTGQVLLWGNRQCLPASMLNSAHASTSAGAPGSLLLRSRARPGSPHVAGAAAGDLSEHSCSQQQPVSLRLLLQPSGTLQVVLRCNNRPWSPAEHDQQHMQPTSQAETLTQLSPPQAHAQLDSTTGRAMPSLQCSTKVERCNHTPNGFDPQQELVADVACGSSHHAVLCQATQHLPTPDELKAAVLTVLRAYITSINSSNSSSLNLLMQQQQQHQSETNWAGSVAGGPAKSTKSVKPAGYAGSVMSFVGSTTNSTCRTVKDARVAAGAAADSSGLDQPGGGGDGTTSRPGSMQRISTVVRRGMVSFAGSTGPGDKAAETTGADGPAGVPAASAAGSRASLLSKADRVAGYAASVAAGSTRGGPAGSVAGSQVVVGGEGPRPGSARPGSGCLTLHGALVLCKEICLLDNITEHLDISQGFALMLHRKRGRMGPAPAAADTATPHTAAALAGRADLHGAVCPSGPSIQCATGFVGVGQAGCASATGAVPTGKEPDTLTVVHVIRPSEPAVPAAAITEGIDTPPTGSRPSSPALGVTRRGSMPNSRPGSSGMFGKNAVGRAAAAASGMDSITALDAEELLELLLLLMKERHPCYRRQPTVLLQILAGWHLSNLKGKSDQGPPWLLRQVLQPDILSALEAPETTELLHGIYVHLAGSSANPQDLSMHLSDLRLGLRLAAGFRTPQDLQQESLHHNKQHKRCQKSQQQGLPGGLYTGDCSSRRQQQAGNDCQLQSYHSSTAASRRRTNAPVPYGPSVHTSASISGTGQTNCRGGGGCGNVPSAGRAFQLPLYNLAAFIRTAKLLPRLLDKYITQLQLKGQEHRFAAGGTRVDDLPVMPCLQLQLQQVPQDVVAGQSHSGQKKRPSLTATDLLQQQGLQGETSRLAPLKEVSSAVSLGASLTGQAPQPQQQPHALRMQDAVSSFFEPLPSQRFERFHSSASISSRLTAAGGVSRRTSADGSTTGRGKQQGGSTRGRSALGPQPPTMQMLDSCVLDLHALDTAELLPMRSKTACIQVMCPGSVSGHGSAARSRPAGSAGSAMNKVTLPLPPAGSSTPADNGGSSSANDMSDRVSQYGSAAWKQVLDSQQQQQQQQATRCSAGRPRGSSASQGNGNVTYHQQQAALQQQRQAAAASAQQAEVQQAACQDAWIVCMLVELLGSSLITPTGTAAVKIPPPSAGTDACLPGATPAAAACYGISDEMANGGLSWCSWEHGYRFSTVGPSSAELAGSPSIASNRASADGAGSGGCAGVSKGMPELQLDLLNHCITYPQFVEVLLCLMAARSVSILEPDVKQIRPLAMDEEMEDHARVLMERISKWRATQLTPWKQQQGQQPQQQQQQQQTNSPATSKDQGPGAAGAMATAACPALEGQQVVCRVYGTYSSMKLGTSVLGLHRDGYMQLLRDAGMLESNNSELSVADAISIFTQTAASRTASMQEAQCNACCTANNTLGDSTSSRPAGMGPDQRQSTFMRCVTQQLMQRLEAGDQLCGAQPAASAVRAPGRVSCSDSSPAEQPDGPDCTAAPEAQVTLPGELEQCAVEEVAEVIGQATTDCATASHDSCGASSPSGVSSRPCSTGQSSAHRLLPCGADTSRPCTSTSTSSQGSKASGSSTASGCTQHSTASGATGASSAPSQLCAGVLTAAGTAAAGVAVEPVLTCSQFLQAMVLLSRRCFPRISNGSRAWKLLLERHVQPLADSRRSRYDHLSASLATPGARALLAAWVPQLRHFHQEAAAAHATRPEHTKQQGLRLSAFLDVLQEKGVIPQLLEPCDVQEVLRQLLVAHSSQDALFCSMDETQFNQALSMCGLAAFASARLQHAQLQLQTPEQQLAAFLTFMGLPRLPGQQQLSAVPAGGASLASVQHLTGTRGNSTSTKQKPTGGRQLPKQLKQQLVADPYMEWWSLQFDPTAESKAHDHLSSLHYMPVMLQDVVQPPVSCPAEVLPLLSAAQSAQQSREAGDALHLLELAEEAWRRQLSQPRHHQPSSDLGDAANILLPAAGVLYLAVSASGCLLSAGRDDEAVAVLQGCARVLADVHEAGADAAVWHAAMGVAQYHCADLKAAFEHCVRAYVLRSECGSLGPCHPDTAAAGHNLGVVLDCLGKCSRGLTLVQEARQVFVNTLGPHHVRTLTAARNQQHIKHKIIKLPAQAQELIALKAAAAAQGGGGGATTGSASFTAGPGNAGAQHTYSVHTGQGKGGRAVAAVSNGRQSGAGSSNANMDTSSTDSDSSSSSSEEDGAGNAKRRTSRNNQTSKRASRTSGRGGSSSSKSGRLQHQGSMQERLQAVVHARQHKEAVADGQQHRQQHADTRDYTDPHYLGSGVFKATLEQRQVYRAFLKDINAHAHGASASSTQPGLVELQVLHPAVASMAPAAQTVVAPAAPCAAIEAQAAGAVKPQQAGKIDGYSSTASVPHNTVPGTAARHAHKGPLADATIAAVKKPLTQQQLAAASRRGNKHQKTTPTMLEKLY